MWPFKDPDEAFREAIRVEFGALASELGSQLVQVGPLIFGFRTSCAVLTIGAYPGHFQGVCVKLRHSSLDEPVEVNDRADIGLANFDAFVTGAKSDIFNKRKKWTSAELAQEVTDLAAKVRGVALPYLTSTDADWAGIRGMIAANVSKSLEAKPWLKKYSQMPNQSTYPTP